jgi:anaphase-promoting complex subunit 3
MQAYLSHSAALNSGPSRSGSPVAIAPNNRAAPVIEPFIDDPFNPVNKASIDSGLKSGGSTLFSKLNGNSNNERSYPDTPVTNQMDDDVVMGEAAIAKSIDDAEPPQAPARKTRTMPAFGTEAGMDAPKMRPITTRSRLRTGAESSDSLEIPRPVNQLAAHKRTISGHTAQTNGITTDPSGPQRRSGRLAAQLGLSRGSSTKAAASSSKETEVEKKDARKAVKATGTKGRSAMASTVGRVVSGNRKIERADNHPKESRIAHPISTQNVPNAPSNPPVMPAPKMMIPALDAAKEKEALQWLLDILGKLGNGYYLLSRYQTHEAIQAFSAVTQSQRETPWVLAQLGRAYYERQSYAEAEEAFVKVRKLCPSRMADMEIYSTVLWHLHKETDLAYLAHTLIESDRLSPESWCAIGNSFNLQREHDQAIKCFKRATQLDPKFAYAYTLQGHEHIANEEYPKALQAFRMAVSADPRHYNAWYGLGTCAEKQEKYADAEKYYRTAAQINPQHAVLVVRIGVVSNLYVGFLYGQS